MSTITHPGFQTEIEFELPKGDVDEAGTLHRFGTMRLATAADEVLFQGAVSFWGTSVK